jgi:DNA-binding PadR family transcriptional regulator
MDEAKVDQLARVLSRQIDRREFDRKSAPAKTILMLVGAGAFLALSAAAPNLPKALKPFLREFDEDDYEVWKRFNIHYLKRTIQRLEKQKLVEIGEENGKQIVKITSQGKKKILRYALDGIEIKKPKIWDGKWRLVSFDLPEKMHARRKIFVQTLRSWGFYPLHKSVYLHAYPCLKEVDFLREYLGAGGYVRIFMVTEIENDKLFREHFGL